MIDELGIEELDDSLNDDKPEEESESDDELEDGLDDSLDDIEEDKNPKKGPPAPKLSKSAKNRRTYKISITYDFYYNTPRLWIQGTDSTNKPLTEGEIYEDIMSDYKGKTVTMEKHPHLGRAKMAEPRRDVRGWRLISRADDGVSAPVQTQSRHQNTDR